MANFPEFLKMFHYIRRSQINTDAHVFISWFFRNKTGNFQDYQLLSQFREYRTNGARNMNGKQQPPGKTILAPIPVNIKYNCALFRDTNIIGNPYPSQLSCKFPYAPAGSHKATDQTPSSGGGSGPREEKAQAFGREENKYYKSHELSSLRARNRRDETRWKAQFPTAINPTRARIAEQTSFPSLPRP